MESKFLVRMSAGDVELICRCLERTLETPDALAAAGVRRDHVEALLETLSARRASRRHLGRGRRPVTA